MPTAWEREQARREKELRQARGEAEAIKRNQKIQKKLDTLDSILTAGINRSDLQVNYESRKMQIPRLDLKAYSPQPMPRYSEFAPPEPSEFARMIPGWQRRYDRKVENAKERYQIALSKWKEDRDNNAHSRGAAQTEHERKVLKIKEKNRRVDEVASDARNGKQYAVEDYVLAVLNYGSIPVRLGN